MTIHRPHPIDGPWPYDRRDGHTDPALLVGRVPTADARIYMDPSDAILYDGCDRCAEHADHPWDSLDDDNVRKLLAQFDVRGVVSEQPTATQQRAVETLAREYQRASRIVQRAGHVTASRSLR